MIMSALHLIWIVPLAASLGYITCAILTVASMADAHAETLHDSKEEK